MRHTGMDDDTDEDRKHRGPLHEMARRSRSWGLTDVRGVPALMSAAVVAMLGAGLVTTAQLGTRESGDARPALTPAPDGSPEALPAPRAGSPAQVPEPQWVPPRSVPQPGRAPAAERAPAVERAPAHRRAGPGPTGGGSGAPAAGRNVPAPRAVPERIDLPPAARAEGRAVQRFRHSEQAGRSQRVREPRRTRAQVEMEREIARRVCARYGIDQRQCDDAVERR